MRHGYLKYATALTAGCLTMAISSAAIAQTDSNAEIEEVVVTGSYIKGKTQSSSPSPISVIGANNLSEIGASTVADLVQTLTINNGAQNNPDAFTQGSTTGTSNFNLRGLGVSSTLVLMNGRRQVTSANVTNDGIAFVDTSALVPQIATQRIEIVKDGAAAIYGTDAVAGVVNFITDDTFEGFEVNAKYQTLTDQGSQSDTLIEGKFGWAGETTNIMVAGSYFNRTPLTTAERRLSRRGQDDTSSLGNPGAFFLFGALPVIDPTGCDAQGGFSTPIGGGAQTTLDNAGLPFTAGFCRFDFGDFFNLVPDEERIQAFGVITQELGGDHVFRAEVSYADQTVERGNSPTFPFLQLSSAVVPTNNPGNIFPAAVGPVLFFGRAIGNGGDVSPQTTDRDTLRLSASVDGTLSGDWTYDVAVTHGVSNALLRTEDTVTANFSAALRGFGGAGCDASTGTAGVGPCEFYNPFATSFSTIPNSQSVLDFVIGTQVTDSKSELTVVDAVISGTAGDIGLALGVQYRDETFSQDFDPISEADGFAFLIGGQDFSRSRDAKAIFAEMFVPLGDTLDFSAAVRYEDYGGNIGDTLDPKFSLLWRPTDEWSLRGSYSTSFRAPSVFQEAGVNTSLNQVTDPLGGTAFAAVRSLPAAGRDIGPEQGKALNFGASYQSAGWELDIDYWHYDFSNVIIQENFQAIVNADPQGDRVIRANGDTGNILIVLVDFVNASSVTTNGLDVNLRYNIDTDYGIIQPFFEGTRVFNYDIDDPQGGEIEGAGSRNFSNFGSPTAETRFNTGIAFTNSVHDARFYVRHISSLTDDENQGQRIGAFTTVDAQYTLNLGGVIDGADGTSLQIGVINAFDKTPPQVFTNGGFESRTHDPRGRSVYARISARF
ncbi:TonB-dependent receptor domain-containing protein [Kordiimonas aquimaris]|uniref:TonB-dependent receptor domain-containing protein n=1 Tax=Kordiimonas aquimaris TaxID=707591 RepID=UPI0021CE6F8F|nr:TonB-dependent receptor [Kordiimonas aquimaris]